MSRRVLMLGVVLCAGGVGACVGGAWADEIQPDPLPSVMVGVAVDSGIVGRAAREAGVGQAGVGEAGVVFRTEVRVPEASWLRLWFDGLELAGTPGVDGSYLVITSREDGAWQRLDAEHAANWEMSSAYFNGDTVEVELWAYPGTGANRLAFTEVMAGEEPVGGRSICGTTDDRELSYDPRVGRLSNGCTGWLIDHGGSRNRLLTAGHCISNGTTGSVMFFNVPLSTATGGFRPPAPEYQYPVQNGSIQSSGSGGVGNDMAVFQTHANSNTGMAPMTAQGSAFVLAAAAPGGSGHTVRVTGFGLRNSDFPQIPPEWSRTQKTHDGPVTSRTAIALRYRPDTTGGNSGSPVILESTGLAVGIHTHGGCSTTGGSNSGTVIEHPTLQGYLANPQGTSIEEAALTELVTTFAGGESGPVNGAVYFDVQTDAGVGALRVRALELNIGSVRSTEFQVFVYRTDGSAEGKTLSPGLWTLAGEGNGLAAGPDGRTRVVLTTPVELEGGPGGRTYGLAVLLFGASHRYTLGSDGAFAAPGATLSAGWATDSAFLGPVLEGRVFNGALAYETVAGAGCPADINGDGVLNFFDVSTFAGLFAAQDPAADFNNDGVFNFFDFSAFLNAFNAGCP